MKSIWTLIPQAKSPTIIGTKWSFKIDNNDIVVMNKAKLNTQEYNLWKDFWGLFQTPKARNKSLKDIPSSSWVHNELSFL